MDKGGSGWMSTAECDASKGGDFVVELASEREKRKREKRKGGKS